MPPKKIFLSHDEVNELAAYTSNVFTEAEKAELEPALKRIHERFGYRCIGRTSAATALRYYILANTDHTVEDLADMTKFSHDELLNYMKGFINMMDDTKRPATECAKDLARMHKNAMQKIQNFRIPEYRFDNIEYAAKYQKLTELLGILYIDLSQDMQDLREGVYRSHAKIDLSPIRKAYNEIYDPFQADLDEQKLDACVSTIGITMQLLAEEYDKGNYQAAAGFFDELKNFPSQFSGKTISELPLSITGSHRYGVNAIITLPKVHNQDKVFLQFLNGETATFPMQKEGREIIKTFENAAMDINAQTPVSNGKELSKMMMEPAISIIPDDCPENILELPEDKKDMLEEFYHLTFETLYRANSLLAAFDAKVNPFDLIVSNGQSVNQIVGNKYDHLPTDVQNYAKKLEVFRILKNNPEGLTLYTVRHTENGKNTGLNDETHTILPKEDSIDIAFTLNNTHPITLDEASEFLRAPKTPDSGKIRDAGIDVRKSLASKLPTVQYMLRKHNLDIFDCIYIGKETVNEIYAKRYSSGTTHLSPGHVEDFKYQIIAMESFHPTSEIFLAMPMENPEGKLISSVKPLTFSGTGISFVPGQQRNNTVAEVRERAEAILNERNAKYNELKAAEESILSEAREFVTNSLDNAYRKEMEERMHRVDIYSKMVSPITNVLLDKVKERINGLYDEIITASNEYETYRIAADLCSNEQLKAKFKDRANEIKNSHPLSDYENYVSGMEYAYGIKVQNRDNLNQDADKLNRFFREQFGYPLPSIALYHDLRTDEFYYRPLEITVETAEAESVTEERIKNLIHVVYNVANAKLDYKHGGDKDNIYFGKIILIDGQPAQDLIHDLQQIGDINDPKNMDTYEGKIASLVADALKKGKNVDFYVLNNKTAGEVLSTVPISIKSSEPVALSANEKSANEARQLLGHTALVNRFSFEDQTKEIIQNRTHRQEQNKEKLFEKEISMYLSGTAKNDYNMFQDEFIARYFPEGYPHAEKLPNAEGNPPTGLIRPERGFPINYVFARIAEESLAKKANGERGYTLSDILDPNKLEDVKKKYVKELTDLCRTNDTVTFNRNLLSASRAYIDLFNQEVKALKVSESPEELYKVFNGPLGFVTSSFHDLYQEMNLISNLAVQKHYNMINADEFERLQDDLTLVSIIKSTVRNADAYKQTVLRNGLGAFNGEEYAPILAEEWVRQNIKVNAALGNPPLLNSNTGVNIGGEKFTGLENTTVMREFLQDKNKAAAIIGNGEFSKYVFVDVDAYYQALQNGDDFDANRFVVKLDPAHPEVRERLERAALNRQIDRMEKTSYEERFRANAAACEDLLKKADARPGSTDLKEISELSNEELMQAERLFDKVFGPVLNRDAVKDYLAANPQKTVFDLFHIGDTSVKEQMNLINEQPQNAAPATPLHMKAAILRMAFSGGVPLTMDVIRKNAQNQIVITGKERILNPNLVERAISERPYLRDLDAFKEYHVKNKSVQSAGELTAEQWQKQYDSAVLESTENVLTTDKITTLDALKAKSNPVLPQDYNMAKMQTVFGPKPVFVIDWVKDDADVYQRDQFNKLKTYEVPNVSEKDFATISMLASMNNEIIFVNPDSVSGYEEDSQFRVTERNSHEWTSAFTQKNPANLGEHYIDDVIEPARKTASEAFAALTKAKPDIIPLGNILLNGIRMNLNKAMASESVLHPNGEFYFHANLLKNATDFMRQLPEVEKAVRGSLSETEKKNLENVLLVNQKAETMLAAQNELIKIEKGEKVLPKVGEHELDPRTEYLGQISDFNYIADKWETNFGQFKASAGYREKDAEIKAKANQTQDLKEIAAINQERDLYIQENIQFSPEIITAFKDPVGSQQFKNQQNLYYSRLEEVKDYIKDAVEEYKTAQAVPETNENGRYIINPADFIDKSEKMARTGYQFNKALNAVLGHMTDAQIREATEKYNEKHPNDKLNYDSVQNVKKEFNILNLSKDTVNGYMSELYEAMSRQIYLTENLLDEVNDIKVPTDLIEDDFEACVEYPLQDKISQIKNDLNKPENAILNTDENKQILDEVNQEYTTTKNEVREYLDKAYNIGHISTAASENAFFSFEEHHNGAFRNFDVKEYRYYQSNDRTMKEEMVNPEKRDAIKNMRENPTIASAKTRRDIAVIVGLMEEFGMIPADGNIPFEQGDFKTYGYHKLGQSRNAMYEAVQRGNIEEIKHCKEAYDLDKRNMKYIFDVIKEKFPDIKETPGNIESTRTPGVPLEFSKDPRTESVMNGLFLLGCQAKRCGISVSDFLKNPIDASFKLNQKEIKKRDIMAQVSTEPTVADAVNKMYISVNGGNPKYKGYEGADFEREVYNGPYSAIGYIRPVEVIFCLEQDQQVKDDMYREFRVMDKTLCARTNAESRNFMLFYNTAFDEMGKEFDNRFKEGIKAALIEGGLSKRHLPTTKTDEYGIKQEDNFKYISSLNLKERYQHLMDEFNRSLPTVNKMVGGRNLMKEALEESMFDYLKAHPEDMERREYKALEKLALSAGKKMNHQSTQAADYLQYKSNFNDKVKDLQNQLKKKEEDFKKEIVELQKQLLRENNQLNRAIRNHQNTEEIRNNIDQLQKKVKDTADRRLLEMMLDYKRQKITQSYMKERFAQLNALKQNPRNTDYLRIPEFISNNPADRMKDCKLISNIVNKKIWPDVIPEMPERFKDVKSYQNYRLHQDESRTVSVTNELSPEEWKNAYQNDFLKYLDEHVPLPEGFPTGREIMTEMEARAEAMQRKNVENRLVHVIENPADNPVVIDNEPIDFNAKITAFENGIKNDFAAYQKQPGEIDANDMYAEDSYKQKMYNEIAELMGAGIAENRNGEVPGGMNVFKFTVANDVQFKKIMMPILDKVKAEATGPVAEGAQRRTDWRDLLIEMIKNRTIVNAYAEQKRNPDLDKGFEMMRTTVIANQGEIRKNIQAANQVAANQQGAVNPVVQEPNQPQAGGGAPHI